MGEKEPEKKEAEKSSGDGGAGAGPTTVVLKVDLHCEGCAQKVKRSLKHIKGVDSVKADYTSNKVTVVGKVDPTVVKEKVEEKIKKKVELLSPQPPKKDKDGGAPAAAPADAKKSEEKAPEKKPDEPKKAEEKKPKEPPPAITVVLKTRVHCDGCAHKMKKIIIKYEGVEDVSVDLSKDQITIKGTMDMKAMLPYLNAKLKRPVDVVPPPAKKDDAKPKEGGAGDGGEKKGKEGGGGEGGEKKGKEEVKPAAAAGGGDKKDEAAKPAAGGGKPAEENVAKMEIVNKMEHYGYPYGYGAHTYNPNQAHESGYVAEYWQTPEYMHAPPQYMQPQQYMHAQQYGPGPSYMHAPPPQMFSDENPNACSVM
ncbi:hypothetical protein V2J09_010614 [Rumex salicifolius]